MTCIYREIISTMLQIASVQLRDRMQFASHGKHPVRTQVKNELTPEQITHISIIMW